MESLTINVRVDANDKKSFEQFCNSVGMNVSTAVNMFIKAVLREQKMPCDIKTNSADELNYKALLEAEKELMSTDKRFTKEEIIEGINNLLG